MVNAPTVQFNESRKNVTPQAPNPSHVPMPSMNFNRPAPSSAPFEDSTFLDMANSQKVRDDDSDMGSLGSPRGDLHSSRPPLSAPGTTFSNPTPHYQQTYGPVPPYNDSGMNPPSFMPQIPDYMTPREPFKTMQEEKSDILNKLFHLKKKGAYHPPRAFSLESDIRELRAEVDQIGHSLQMENGVKFARKMLIAAVTGMEFLNKRFDPFHIELDGWSENIMENVSDYDNVFERLVQKYSGRGNTPPEIELLLALVGSAMMFHLTKNIFKGGMPGVGDVLKNNPNFLQSIMKSMGAQPQIQPQPQQQPSQPQPTNNRDDDVMSEASTVFEPSSRPKPMRGPDLTRFNLMPQNTLPSMHTNRSSRMKSEPEFEEMSLNHEIESLAESMSEMGSESDLASEYSELLTDKRKQSTRTIKVLPNKKFPKKR